MNNLLFSFNSVAPLFLIIFLGMICRKINLMSAKTLYELNKVAYRIFVPVFLFHSISITSIQEVFRIKFFVFSIAAILVIWPIIILSAVLLEKRSLKRGALIQGILRTNFALFGLPLLNNLYGFGQTGIASFMVAVIIPLLNILAVISLEFFRGSSFHPQKALWEIAKNPLIIGSISGLLVLLTGLQLPQFLETTVSNIAQVATPLALFVIGGSLEIKKILENKYDITVAVIGRLIVVPALILPIAILMGFRGIEAATILAIFASPTAINSYALAMEMESDGDLAAEIVVFTTLISGITIFLWIFGLKLLNVL